MRFCHRTVAMDPEEYAGTIRAFAVNAHDPDAQHDVLFLGVGGIFAAATLKVEKTAHSCLITDGDTGTIAVAQYGVQALRRYASRSAH